MKLYDIQEPGTSLDKEFLTAVSEEVAVGIDLGTTNSLIACIQDKKTVIIPDQYTGKNYTPSIVSYHNGSILVGDQALQSQGTIISSVKRLMGKGIHETSADLPYKLDTIVGMPHIIADNLKVSPAEVSAEILKYLKSGAEKYLGKAVEKAVVTIPAYFDETARQATRDAARLAGLEVLRLLSEPTSAAIAYGLDQDPQGIYAIYDLGGGTFDISIIKMQNGVFQVLATGGDTMLGGDDIDRLILKYFNLSLSFENLQVARALKEQLSLKAAVTLKDISLSLQQFNALIKPLIKRTIKTFTTTIKEAGVKITSLKQVILVGGSTRIPLIKQEINALIGKSALDSINPEEIVVTGASMQASALSTGSSSLLIDVIPLSLGIEVADGIVERMIPRNTPIPTAHTQTFATQKDGQTGFVIHVVQGEHDKVKDCRSLAHFELKGFSPLAAGAIKIELKFQVDADGLLIVSAKDVSAGKTQVVTVKPSYGLTEEYILRLLANAK